MTDGEKYTKLLLRHRKLVWRLCRRYARGDYDRCADLVQEVAVALWEYYGRLRVGTTVGEERILVEGLEDWLCRRREKARDRRLYLATTCVMLVLVSVAYRLAPTADYRLAEGVSYEELVEINNKMLEQ